MNMRRNRWTQARRDLVAGSNWLDRLVQPHFVVAGQGINEEVSSMPGVFRQSVDVLLSQVESDLQSGLKHHMLFPVLSEQEKDETASLACNDDMPLQEAIRQLRAKFGDSITLFSDVCLCTATSHGHCGVLVDGQIDNAASLPILSQIALSHARAGVDYVACSDMMDGRVLEIRAALDSDDFVATGILSYAVKYASSFYGPFRDAACSSPAFGDRKTHQMDPRSDVSEAIQEALLDIGEGADIIMVKPGLPYLDVIRAVRENVDTPVAVYNVSGEYAMVQNAANDEQHEAQLVSEVMHAFYRAGAGIIVTYHARKIAQMGWL